MKKNYYTPQIRFHKLRFNAAIQAASDVVLSNGGSNDFDDGPCYVDSKGYSSFYYDEDEE